MSVEVSRIARPRRGSSCSPRSCRSTSARSPSSPPSSSACSSWRATRSTTRPTAIADGFPGDLFVILAGVTFLFAIAKNNGTVDWLVHQAVRSVGGRIALIPWIMFLVTGLLTAFGAVVPAAVAIIAPIGHGLRPAATGINPVLMGLMIINGATAGGFSPLSIFGIITNGVVARRRPRRQPAVPVPAPPGLQRPAQPRHVLPLRRPRAAGRGARPGDAPVDERDAGSDGGRRGRAPARPRPPSRPEHARTAGATGAASTDHDDRADHHPRPQPLAHPRRADRAGRRRAVLRARRRLLRRSWSPCCCRCSTPNTNKGAVAQVAWPTVLLICGIVTYVSLLQNIGTVDFLGEQVAAIGARCWPPADLLHRRGGLGVRLHHRHPRRAHPAGRAVPAGRRGRRGRPDHRAGDLLLGRRLLAVLHLAARW